MGAELAVQQLLGVGRTLAAEGLPLTELLADAAIDDVDLGNPACRLDWQHYAAVLDCVARRRGFDPYFSTKPVGQGTGLGLSSVWGLVKQAGGHASLANHPAGGAVIDLYLRAADDSASTSQAHLGAAQESS